MLQVDLLGAGVWIKDASRSDLAAYERALDLMGLNGLQKTTALRLIEGVEIQQDATAFSVNFLTVVPFFKVPHACCSTKICVMLKLPAIQIV